VDDASIRKFVMSPQVVGYFENLITFLRQQMLNLDGLVMEAARLVLSSSVLLFLCFFISGMSFFPSS
jgi:hypothetical protein